MIYLLAVVLLSASVLTARAMLGGGREKTPTPEPAASKPAPPQEPAPAESAVLPEPAEPATKPAAPSVDPAPPSPGLPEEGRAVWVTRWNYRKPADVERIMKQVASANLNIVYFQVRGAGDAFYRSDYEPWAASLSGRLGKNPGWDPLSVAVESAHKHGLKLHAWINVYPLWYANQPAPPRTNPVSPYYRTNWRIAAGPMDGYYWGSPGNPSLQNHVYRVATDIVTRYDVDGLHMDRVRYPSRNLAWDKASRSAFTAADRSYRRSHPGKRLSRSSWQTGQVSGLVGRISKGVKAKKPHVQVSAAAWGIYRDKWGWGSSDGLRDFYQDGQGWMKKGYVDILAPMTYWKIKQTPPWGTLVKDFVANRGGAMVYPGIAVYKYRDDWREVVYQVRLARRIGAQGVSFFDYSSLEGRWDDLRRLYPKKAAAPGTQAPQTSPPAASEPGGE
ncbi:MAG: hypothetical protein C4521_11065 [Actinobacteria bacterium]|nr:MAG: hypothetical protein C4521_11065 [Actinomycetota bacterium]